MVNDLRVCERLARLHPGHILAVTCENVLSLLTGGQLAAGSDPVSPTPEYVRGGDTVVVWKLDRLGRNTLHILETVKALTDRGVTLVSTTDGIDSSTAAGRMMIGVLGLRPSTSES